MSEKKKSFIAKEYYRYFPLGMLVVIVASAAVVL